MNAFIDQIKHAFNKRADPSSPSKEPAFDSSKITTIFVLGGPGAGKGTQCALLVEKYGFCHLSAGDLLREEQRREGSEYGQLIQTYISEGKIVPMEITIKLLENAMKHAIEKKQGGEHWDNGQGLFLIDGFPRKMDQAIRFDEDVCLSSLVLFYSTTEEVMLSRLLERGKTSGRVDDNAEVIKKRFNTYKEETMPVIQHYQQQTKVAEIDSSRTVEEIHAATCAVIDKVLSSKD